MSSRSEINTILMGAWKTVLSTGFQVLHLHGKNPSDELGSLVRLEGWNMVSLDMSNGAAEERPYSPWSSLLGTLVSDQTQLHTPHPLNQEVVRSLILDRRSYHAQPPILESLSVDRKFLCSDIANIIKSQISGPKIVCITNFQRISPEGLDILEELQKILGPETPLLLILHFDPRETVFFQNNFPEFNEYFNERYYQGLMIDFQVEHFELLGPQPFDPVRKLEFLRFCRQTLATKQGLRVAKELQAHRKFRMLKPEEKENFSLNMGILSMQDGDYETALIMLLDMIPANPTHPDFFESHLYLAEVFLHKDHPEEAKKYIFQALESAARMSPDFWGPLFLYLKLYLYHKQAEESPEIQDYHRLVRTLEQYGLTRHLMFTLFYYPNEWSSAQSMQDSLWMVERGIVMAQENTDEYFLSVGYHRKAILLAGISGEDSAQEFYIKAVEAREPLGEPLPLIQIQNGITYSYLNQGDFSSAFFYIRKSLGLLDKIREFAEMGVTLFNLAQIYLFGRNFDRAAEVCHYVLKMMQTLNMEQLPFNPQVHVLLTLAFARLRTGKIPEGLGSLIQVEKQKHLLSDHFVNIYHIARGWSAAIRGQEEEEISKCFEEAKTLMPETKTFKKRSTAYLMAEYSQALEYAGHSSRSETIWQEAAKMAEDQDWKGFRRWFHSSRSRFFEERESFPSMPFTLGIFEALFKQEKSLNSLYKRIQEIQFLNQSLRHFQNAKNKEDFAIEIVAYISRFLKVNSVDLWEFFTGDWNQLARWEQPGAQQFTPDLLNWLILNQANQVLYPGSHEFTPPELQRIWDNILVFPLKSGQALSGVLLLTAPEGDIFHPQDSEVLRILSNHITSHIITLQRNEMVESLTSKDSLTGLLTKTVLEERLSQEIKRVQRYSDKDASITLAHLNLDHFHFYNEQFGNLTGDYLLVWFSELLKIELRETDLIFRLEEDSFLLLFPQSRSKAVIPAIQRIYESLEEVHFFRDKLEHALGEHLEIPKEMSLSVSTGISEYQRSDNPLSHKKLLEHAKQACILAKEQNPGSWIIWEDEA